MRGKCSNCKRDASPLLRKRTEEGLCNSCVRSWNNGENMPNIEEEDDFMDPKSKAAKGLRERKAKVENDGSMEMDDSLSLRGSKGITGLGSPLLAATQKVDVDLSKMTERQQIAYLLRESNGLEASPTLKEPIGVEEAERATKRSPTLTAKRPSVEELDEAWSSEEKPKKRKKDKPKKVEVRIGQIQPIRKQRKNEAICALCEDGGNLLMCEGPCLRSFHVDCLGMKVGPVSRWECDDCSKHMSQCFFCKQKGEIGRELMKCKVHQCGKYYHYKCVSQLKLAKLINSKAKRFNCPLHYCATCEVSGDGKQSAHCFRCPTAYHVICMPSTAKLLTDKSKETRKTGLILCPKHTDDPPENTRGQLVGAAGVEHATEVGTSSRVQAAYPFEDVRGAGITSTPHLYDNGADSEDSGDEYIDKDIDHKDLLGVTSDENQKHIVDKAAEEVHMRYGQNGFGGTADVDKHNMRIKIEPLAKLDTDIPPFKWASSTGLTSVGAVGSRNFVVQCHKDLDDVEREIMEQFDREAQNSFGIDLGVLQPPKQRQKKMDRIHLLENKFREEITHYKNSLVLMRDSLLARNQIDFEAKVQNLRSEHHRLDIETEESLSRKFVDWGERILEQKRSVMKRAKLENNNNNGTAASLLQISNNTTTTPPLQATQLKEPAELTIFAPKLDYAPAPAPTATTLCASDISSLVSECMVSMSESASI